MNFAPRWIAFLLFCFPGLSALETEQARPVLIVLGTRPKDKIELFFLPPYAPEYNPDEYLNNAVKGRTHRQKMSRNQEELTSPMRSTLAELQKEPETIKNLFRAPAVLYAA